MVTDTLNRLYAKLIYANNRLNAKLILKDIAASTERLCTAFVYNSQSSNGVQNIMSKLFKHYKLLTKAVWPYATLKLYTKLKGLTYHETATLHIANLFVTSIAKPMTQY